MDSRPSTQLEAGHSGTPGIHRAYIGCRTTQRRDGHGKGIEVFALERNADHWTSLGVAHCRDNPSYLCINASQTRLYTVHGDESEVSVFAIDPDDGTLQALQTVSSGGLNPVHLAMNEDETCLYVANYATGSVAALELDEDGLIGAPARVLLLKGETGPHRIEQKGAQPHQIVVAGHGRFLIVPDKGTDQIHVLRVEAGELVSHFQMQCREGSGPRHLVLGVRSDIAYVVNELDSTMTVLRWDEVEGTLEAIEVRPTVPSTFTGDSRGAAIVLSPRGDRLYVSNRGHDSICIFELRETGMPSQAQWIATRGSVPRFICLDPSGNRLIVANERSDTIVVFDVTDGAFPTNVGTIHTGSPVCIVFAVFTADAAGRFVSPSE